MNYYLIGLLLIISGYLLFRCIKLESKIVFLKRRSLKRATDNKNLFGNLSDILTEMVEVNGKLEKEKDEWKGHFLISKTKETNLTTREKIFRIFLSNVEKNSESILNYPGLFQFRMFFDVIKLKAVVTAFDNLEQIHTFEITSDSISHTFKSINTDMERANILGLGGIYEN